MQIPKIRDGLGREMSDEEIEQFKIDDLQFSMIYGDDPAREEEYARAEAREARRRSFLRKR